MSPGQIAILVGILFAAILTDLALIKQLRKRKEGKEDESLPEGTEIAALPATEKTRGPRSETTQGSPRRAGAGELPAGASGTPQKTSLQPHPGEKYAPITAPAPSRERSRSLFARLKGRSWPLAGMLFGLALGLYLAVRLVGLQDYPIYFFSDEAVNTVLAADMARDHFSYEGTFLPTYFRNGRKFSLSASVYAQIIPTVLFGKSVLVTRGTSVVITLIAALGVGLMARNFLKLPYWWSATLLLSITPAWFLHSRTAFETAMACAFYTGFLVLYLRYRSGSPKSLYWALTLGALAFYTYVSAQLVVVITGLALLIVDFRYHWDNRKTGLRAAGLLILFALPYLRFYVSYSDFVTENLRETASYWLEPIPVLEKFGRYFQEYFHGLSPAYWYFPNGVDISRHTMQGYGNILWFTLPFALLGLYFAVRNLQNPACRLTVIALLAAPAGAAVSGLGVTRALFFVIPAAILSTIGLSKTLAWLEGRWLSPEKWAWGVFTVLAAINVWMAADALRNGPFWYTDYGMGGMQYGARQVFGEVESFLKSNPGQELILSPDWVNGTDILARFFLSNPQAITLDSLEGYLNELRPFAENALFVVPAPDYERIVASGKFNYSVERVLPYPDGSPGFYFVRMRYVDNIEEILAYEQEARRTLVEDQALLEGSQIPVRHSVLDMGEAGNLFDGDASTLIRTAQANPAVIEFSLPEPRTLIGMFLVIGVTEARVTVYLSTTPGAEPVIITRFVRGTVKMPTVLVDFSQTVTAQTIRVEVEDLHQTEPAHIHLWEIQLVDKN